MTNSFFTTDLYKIYKTLAEEEVEGLMKAANSPLFNECPEVVNLLEWMGQNTPASFLKGTPAGLNEKIAEKVFEVPGIQLSEAVQRLPEIRTRCLQLLKEFLAWQEFQRSRTQKSRAICRALRRQNLLKLYEKEYQNTQSELWAKDAHEEDQKAESLGLLREYYQSNLLKVGGQNVNESFDINEYPEAFFHQTLAERTLQIFLRLSVESSEPIKDLALQNETLVYVSAHLHTLPTRIQLFYHLCQNRIAIKTEQNHHVSRALTLWEQERGLSAFEEYHILLELLKPIFSWIAKDNPDGLPALERVRKRIFPGHLKAIGGMPPKFFLNFIRAYTTEEKVSEAEIFFECFLELVQEEYKTVCEKCGKLFILVKKGQDESMDEAINLTRPNEPDFDFGDAVLESIIRVQKLKAFYATKDSRLDAYMEAFRRFLPRKIADLKEENERKFNNFLKSLTQLSSLRKQSEKPGSAITAFQIEQFVQKMRAEGMSNGERIKQLENMPKGERAWLAKEARKLEAKS